MWRIVSVGGSGRGRASALVGSASSGASTAMNRRSLQ